MIAQPSRRRVLIRIALTIIATALLGSCAAFSNVAFYGNLFRANRAGVRFRRTYEHLELGVLFSDRA